MRTATIACPSRLASPLSRSFSRTRCGFRAPVGERCRARRGVERATSRCARPAPFVPVRPQLGRVRPLQLLPRNVVPYLKH